MKKLYILALVILSLSLFGCPNPEVPPELPVVEKIPQLWTTGVGGSGSMRNIVIGEIDINNDPSWWAITMAPVTTGWADNTEGYKVGDSFENALLGYTVTTTISSNGSDIIFTGNFDDGGGQYIATYHPDGSFDYTQRLIVETDSQTNYFVSEVSATSPEGEYIYQADGTSYIYEYISADPLETTGLYSYKYHVHAKEGYFGSILKELYFSPVSLTPATPVYHITDWVDNYLRGQTYAAPTEGFGQVVELTGNDWTFRWGDLAIDPLAN